MGRPPSNGGPSFRFNQAEIAEMEYILQAHKTVMPTREVLVTLAEKFSNSEERKGKIEVQMKQVWNWFQNRRYAIRAKAGKSPGKLNITQMTRDDSTMVKGVPQATQPHAASSAAVRTFPQAPQNSVVFSGRAADNSQMEYEAKSARDGAWYDVSTFLSHRSLETGDPEVLVRFAGFGAEEDEWVNVRKNVRQRSLPCEASECVAVLPADLILCFQEGKEQALYFDAHVLDAQRRRHDVRGCRCRFLVRYDHDQSEEIVALRKICRRPETDYRLQQLHAVNESLSANQNKNGGNNIHTVSTLRVYPPAEVYPKQLKAEPVVVVPPPSPAEAPQKRQKVVSDVPPPLPETPTVVVDVPQDQQKVQLVVPAPTPAPSDQPLVELQKVEPVVAVPSDKVPLELQKVQPVVADPSGEVSHEPEAVGPLVPPSADTSPPLAATETAVKPPCEGESEVVEPKEEPMVCSSSVEVQAEMPKVQPASELEAVEIKSGVQVELPEVQPLGAVEGTETKPAVPEELTEVQPASALEAIKTTAEAPLELPKVQPANAFEAVETKAEVQAELPEVQPPRALEGIETKAVVPEELPEVQPASAPEAMETKDEVPLELPEVQPESALEAVESKVEVEAELPVVQPASEFKAIESKAEVPDILPEVQPANALDAAETKAEVPEELPEVQPASAFEAIETKTEVPAALPEVQPASELEAMETETEESAGPVSTKDCNVVEAEIEEPKVPENMDIDDTNTKEGEHATVVENASIGNVGNSDLQPGTITDDMEEV